MNECFFPLISAEIVVKPRVCRWKISGKKKDLKTGRTKLTVELEVVLIDKMGLVGVKRKRLNGDAFLYKHVCEDILKLAGL